MFFKNLSIASRFLLKHKHYTAINVFGLTLSVVCALFIGLYMYDELTFDMQHRHADRIYRVIEHKVSPEGTTQKVADVAFRISTLHEQLPQIEKTAKLVTFGRANFFTEENENKIYEPFIISEQGFMDIFDFKIIDGSKENSLRESHTVVITKSTAIRLFGKTDVTGKIIRNDRDPQGFRITAVLDDFPANSHLQPNMLFSFESFSTAKWYTENMPSDWSSSSFSTYILTQEKANASKLEKSITAIVNSHRDEKNRGSSFLLQPLKDIHFKSTDITGGFASNPGEIYYLYIFAAIGIFILLIACINYINLSTSLAITRGKEVGVKKVAGAGRYNLIAQFITESNLVSFAALIFSLFLVNLLLPYFNQFTEKQLSMSLIFEIRSLVVLVAFAFLIGTLSGSYPAFYLSRFNPARAIKGYSSSRQKSAGLRQGLVVFQFALSITLIFATLIAFQQLSFIRSKNLGFSKDQIVVLDINSGLVRAGSETIKNELSKISVVEQVSVSSRVPGEWKDIPHVGATTMNHEQESDLVFMGIDESFLSTYKIDLISGRNFRPDHPGDSLSFLINEAAAREFGLTEAIDQPLSINSIHEDGSSENFEKPFAGKIIGVVKDFHFQSLHQKIAPLVLAYQNNPIHNIDYFSVRLAPGDWQGTLKEMEKVMQRVDPAHLIEYNFLDQRLNDFYKQDIKRGQIFGIAAAVSIGLACLGLFSLASFMTEQRTKEIGIRKALGASAAQIVRMLSVNYIKLVAIGFLVATPFAIWMLNKWLTSFAYHVDITWITVALACILSFAVALVTVGYKSVKAALENPVKSLRSE